MAPEMHNSEDGFKGKPTDIFSMGVTIYTYLNEKGPFWADTQFLIQAKTEKEEVPKLENFSDDLNDLIQKMVVKTPEDRPTASECLQHKWFSNE